MIFKVKGRKKKEKPVLELELVELPGGEVDVVGCELGDDTPWCLMRFCSDGTILLFVGLSSSIGFQLDDKGRIIVRNN